MRWNKKVKPSILTLPGRDNCCYDLVKPSVLENKQWVSLNYAERSYANVKTVLTKSKFYVIGDYIVYSKDQFSKNKYVYLAKFSPEGKIDILYIYGELPPKESGIGVLRRVPSEKKRKQK